MAKTYNSLSSVTVGSVLTASDYNKVLENSNNYRVPPMCRLRLNTTAAIGNNSDTVCAFTTVDFDTDATMATTGAAAKITAKTAGIYLVTAGVQFAANTTGNRAMSIRKNAGGAASAISGVANAANYAALSGLIAALNVSVVLSLAVNDYVDVQVYQSSGGNLNVGAGAAEATFLSAIWLGQSS